MNEPTFDQIMAYQRKRRAVKNVAVYEPVKAKENKPDYSAMSRSDLFKIAKERGWDRAWIASSQADLVAFMENA